MAFFAESSTLVLIALALVPAGLSLAFVILALADLRTAATVDAMRHLPLSPTESTSSSKRPGEEGARSAA